MSYSSTDLVAIDAAILAFAAGDRVSDVTCNGRRIKYADVTLLELQNLRGIISRSLNGGRRRFSQIISSKGL